MAKVLMNSVAGRADQATSASTRLKNLAQYVALPMGFLVVWELLGKLDLLPYGIIPPPSVVVQGWYEWAFGPQGFGLNPYSGTWFSNVRFSAQRVAQGYALAVVLGVPVGILIGWSRVIARLTDPLVQSLRPIPITAWLPFSIALFGIRDFGAIFLICLGAFYPIVVNSTHGSRDINRNLIRAATMMGASNRQLLFRVIFPNALPSIFAGMRIALGIAWTAVIVAEMVAVKSGLGYVLWDAYYVGRMDVVIADMASIGIMGFLSDRIIVILASRVLHWKHFHSH